MTKTFMRIDKLSTPLPQPTFTILRCCSHHDRRARPRLLHFAKKESRSGCKKTLCLEAGERCYASFFISWRAILRSAGGAAFPIRSLNGAAPRDGATKLRGRGTPARSRGLPRGSRIRVYRPQAGTCVSPTAL